MTTDSFSFAYLPAAVRGHLTAHGISDEAGLRAALDADPSLAGRLQAVVANDPEASALSELTRLFADFALVENAEGMFDFWRKVPSGMEEVFIQAVETIIAETESDGQTQASELRARLDAFRRVHRSAQQTQQRAEEQAQQRAQELQEMPPILRTVIAFVQAQDDAAAESIFAEQKDLLQPDEAQDLLDHLATQPRDDTPVETRQQLAARAALLRRLRAALF